MTTNQATYEDVDIFVTSSYSQVQSSREQGEYLPYN